MVDDLALAHSVRTAQPLTNRTHALRESRGVYAARAARAGAPASTPRI